MRSEIIRPYIERVIGQWLEAPVMKTDDEGRYHVRVNTSGFVVEIVEHEPTLIRLWSPVVMGIGKTPALLDTLNGLNTTGLGLRVFHVDDKVVLATELVAETLDAEELGNACNIVGRIADKVGPELQGQFGGRMLFEEEIGEPSGVPAPTPDGPVANAGYL